METPEQEELLNNDELDVTNEIEVENQEIDEEKHDESSKLECLNSNLTANQVSSDLIQYLVVNIEEMVNPLDEQIIYQIDSIRKEQFFATKSPTELLSSFPLLKLVYLKYVPSKMEENDFWQRFIWFVHYYHWTNHQQDFSMEEVTDDQIRSTETELLLDEDDNGEEKKDSEKIKLDYHSVNRYIASAILSFLKVFIVCAVLKQYNAPMYYYLYPALWVVIGFLIILRALQIQRQNNAQVAKLEQMREEGIELQEMESV